MTLKNSYQFFCVIDYINSPRQAKHSPVSDAYYRFCQMHIREKSCALTAFATRLGTHQYVRMPISLTNAPASFWGAFELLLTEDKKKIVFCLIWRYKNFLPDVEDHTDYLDKITTSSWQAELTLKILKCRLFTKRNEYIGHFVEHEKLKFDYAHTTSLRDVFTTTNQSKLRFFMNREMFTDVECLAHKERSLYTLLVKPSSGYFCPSDKKIGANQNLIDSIHFPCVLSLPAQPTVACWHRRISGTAPVAPFIKCHLQETDTTLVTGFDRWCPRNATDWLQNENDLPLNGLWILSDHTFCTKTS